MLRYLLVVLLILLRISFRFGSSSRGSLPSLPQPAASRPATIIHYTLSFFLCLQVGGDRSKKSSGGKKGKSFSFLCLTHIDARPHGAPLHPRLWEMDFTFLPPFYASPVPCVVGVTHFHYRDGGRESHLSISLVVRFPPDRNDASQQGPVGSHRSGKIEQNLFSGFRSHTFFCSHDTYLRGKAQL